MKYLKITLLSIFALQGCATVAEVEVQQLSYQGTGKNHCFWGGVTEKAEAHCAEVRWGVEGYLMAVNKAATKDLAASEDANPCQAHVARLQEVLKDRADLSTQVVYTCPKDLPDCHVSLLVTDAGGNNYVLDNGAVMRDTDSVAGVGSLQQFAALVDGNYRLITGGGHASQIMLAAH